jgi:hypothetical protein
MAKPAGWRKEPARHSLAAKGVKTGRVQRRSAPHGLASGLDGRYNGYKNYETWSVSLWLSNEQFLDDQMGELADQAVAEAPDDSNVKTNIWSEREAARYNLSKMIKDWVDEDRENVPGMRENNMYTQLLDGALSDVDWGEVADGYLEDRIKTLKG